MVYLKLDGINMFKPKFCHGSAGEIPGGLLYVGKKGRER